MENRICADIINGGLVNTHSRYRYAKLKSALLITLLFGLPLSFNACGDVNLKPTPADSSFDEASQSPAYTKPALAVRGAMCLMCHANVNGDVITDFGYKNPFFLAGGDTRYSMRADAWSDATVTGNTIVPQGLTNEKDPSSPTIKQMLAATGFKSPISERKEVFIGAPTEEVITNLTHLPDAVLLISEWDITAFGIGPQSFVRGLLAQQGPQGDFYFTNPINKTLWCEGDIILLGPVHFNNLKLKTGAQGCRIYTRNTVFITGPVSYVESPVEANLQISSARAIYLGLRDIELRLGGDEHAIGIRAAPTADTEKGWDAKIFEDRNKIGPALVEDTGPFRFGNCAGQPSGTFRFGQGDNNWRYLATNLPVAPADLASCSDQGWAGGNPQATAARKTVNYNGLVLNAPKVHSRYFGTFKGLVIGEDVIFAIGKFKFEFDPNFSRLSVLPLLKGRILRVSDN